MSRAEDLGTGGAVDASTQVAARPLAGDDWPVLRSLRLAALADSPGAFVDTLAEALTQNEGDWRTLLASGTTLAAERDGRPVGMVATFVPPLRPQQAELVAMWVAPQARGQGVGAFLVAAVVGWARARQLSEVGLWVMRGNEAAERLYSRCGFVRTTDYTPDADDACADEIRMVLDLSGASTAGHG